MKKLFYCVITILTISSCANIDKAMTGSNTMPTQTERTTIVSQFPELSAEQKQQFINGEAWVGMSQEQLKAMWNNEPIKSQKKLTAAGNSEIQLYQLRVGDWKTGIKSKFYKMTFTNGKISELQEVDGDLESMDNR
ncbi:hypothetical protein [Pseudobdellovibrio exovorus]|uniref:Lipoprotein n=1 Tax=Pseudobdellovibrio exovorus JSS TaxID=1184267 RepID=M4VBM9_9BACT|nr:hypothetical protein [Pseudobdellovibrio exovorus]AGH96623.1 hypothetical protein A11Q_2407 [Pseudobdellovibrio exovorus JSS]